MIKRLLLFFLFCYSTSAFSQGLAAPSSLTIAAGASGVDAGDFVVSWPNNTESILVSVSLDYQSGATLSFPTTSGLTFNTGYTSWTGVTSVVFYGVRDNINAALAAMTVSMGSIKTAIRINVEISSYDANYVYNPINKHFYRYVAGNVSYTSARTNAGTSTYNFKGKTGYLVTITSQSEQDFINNNISGNNVWFAATDEITDGTWVIDAGPEKGVVLKTQNGPTAGNSIGVYNNWCSGEPNGANHSEDYAVTKWGGGNCWNDLANSYASVAGYIVEISADFPAGSDYTGVYSAYIVHNNDAVYTLGSGSSNSKATWSNTNAMIASINVNSGHTISVPVNNTIYSGKLNFPGTGKITFADNTSKWMPTPILKSCKDIITYFPLAASGVYSIDPDGAGALPSISCYCDMETDNGGWTLVLNYLHAGGTNPILAVKASSLPLLGSTSIGVDESASSTTWGHVSNSYLSNFSFTELRFYGKTSLHSRIIHYKTTHPSTISYFKTGVGSMSGIQSSYTALAGHTGLNPGNSSSFYSGYGDNAMTEFPFWIGAANHWGIRGNGYRWEVDDYPNNSSNSTHHQIWIR
jgi:Fibrinogen beta and gamma chains, C-terminal globular domain